MGWEVRNSLAVLALAAVHEKCLLTVVTFVDTKIHMADKPIKQRNEREVKEREREKGEGARIGKEGGSERSVSYVNFIHTCTHWTA